MSTKLFIKSASLESITFFNNITKKYPTLVCPCKIDILSTLYFDAWLSSDFVICHYLDDNEEKKFTVFNKNDLIFPTK